MDTQTGVTFIGWLEDLGDLLPAVNQRTWAIIQTQNKKFWLVKLTDDQTSANQLTTSIAGKKYQIQGVATVLDLHKLVKNPYFVSKILTKNSLDNFYYMLEMSEHRNLENAMIVDKLVKNEPLPQKALNFLLDFFKTESNLVFNRNTGQSELTLLLKDESGKYTDRSIIEDGKPKHTRIRPYESISASIKNLASGKGDFKFRKDEKNKAIINVHRAVADSLGYNLDEILDDLQENTTGAKLRIEDIANIPVRKGRLHQALESHKSEIIKEHGKIDGLLHNQSFLKEVVGVSDRELDPVEIEFLQKWIKEEEFVLRFSILKFVDKDKLKLQDLVNYWKSIGLPEDYDGESYYVDELKSSINQPANQPLMGGAVRFSNILKSGSLLESIENKEDELAQDTYDMVKNKRKDLVRTIERMRMQFIGRNPEVKDKVNKIAELEYDVLHSKGLDHEYALTEARRKGQAYVKQKVREALKRTDNALLMSRYAERLFVLGLMEDIWGKAGTEDDVLNKILLAKRFSKNLTESIINKEKLPEEQTAITDHKEASRIKKIQIETQKSEKETITVKADPVISAIIGATPLKQLTEIKKNEGLVKSDIATSPLTDAQSMVVNSSEINNIYGEYGIFSVLERIYQDNNLIQRFNLSDFSGLTEKEFLMNLGQSADSYGQKAKLYDFYKNILESLDKVKHQKIDVHDISNKTTLQFAALASSLGLDKDNNLEAFKKNFNDFFDNDKGKDLFDILKTKGLKDEDRLEFLKNLNFIKKDNLDTESEAPKVVNASLKKGIVVEIPIDKKLKDVEKLPAMLSTLKLIPVVNETPLKSNFTELGSVELNCLYGEYGIYPVLSNIYGRNNLFKLYGVVGYSNVSENSMLLNVGQSSDSYGNKPYFYDFYQNMKMSLDPYNTAAILRNEKHVEHLIPYLAIGASLGLIRVVKRDGIDLPELNHAYIDKFRTKFDKFFENHLGKELFDRLEEFGLKPEERYAFLRKLDQQGISDFANFANIGLLTVYTQYIEATSRFFSKNIIFNPDINKIPVLGPLLYKPTQAFIKTLGFTGDKNVLAALLTSKLIKDIESQILIFIKRSKMFKYSGGPDLGTTVTSETQKYSLEDFYKNLPSERFSFKNLFRGFGVSSSTKHKIESAANTSILGVGFLASESVAKIVPPVWNAAWNFTTGIIMLKPFRYLNSRLLTIHTGIGMLIKIITYPITTFFLGCVGLLGILTFAIAAFIGSSFATFEKTDQIGGLVAASGVLKITQHSVFIESEKKITYTVAVQNISSTDISIDSYKSDISLVPPCSIELPPLKLNDSGFIGKIENPSSISENNTDLVGKTLKPNEKIEFDINLIEIESVKGSYINDVQVTAIEEKTSFARDIARVDVKESGCFKCPAGWAVAGPLAVYQGAFTRDGTHDRIEAIDIFSVPLEAPREVKATHDGRVYVNLHSFDRYGFNVQVRSTDNTYMTIYGHLAYPPNIANGTFVSKGTTLGMMGSTGIGDKHLHYEFRDIPWSYGPNHYACIAGEPLKAKQVNQDSYVPRTIPQGCLGFSSCNVKVN